MKYKKLIGKVKDWAMGEIYDEELKEYFFNWAKENNYPLSKKIRFLNNMAYNSIGDIVIIVNEDEENVYYNDSCHRWCYLEKKDEGIDFEYIS